MEIYKITLLSFALFIIGCEKNEAILIESSNALTASDLIGNWQAIEYSDSEGNMSTSSGFTFGLYCDAILLKEDQTFAVYYQSAEVNESREDGTWSLEDSNLDLNYGGAIEIPVTIIDLEDNLLTLRYSWLDGIIETVKFKRK